MACSSDRKKRYGSVPNVTTYIIRMHSQKLEYHNLFHKTADYTNFPCLYDSFCSIEGSNVSPSYRELSKSSVTVDETSLRRKKKQSNYNVLA